MIGQIGNERVWRVRLWNKDLGVALVTMLALLAGTLLMWRTETATRSFVSPDETFRLAYPAHWVSVDALNDLLLKVEDPQTASLFKTTLSVEQRDIDPANPPTLQELLDRRMEDRSLLTAYHFLREAETAVAGQRAIATDFAYVVQPIDEPRRPALPVVVRVREYIFITANHSFYLTLAAPAAEFDRLKGTLARIIASVEVP
ncbi:hypothetical protein [uncultured Chloroflexus sp.]|uniref:hypothetical protein n=1 Tax=uncultured Chloroflexus sp. TaxID=214040 RepID=UPI002626B27E|nr:hypothetical protein [uncultured Chloroflexus sp.]